MSFPWDLRHFAREEFHHPDEMDADFLHWLDRVRESANVVFRVTSDFRTPTENAAASGSSSTSLHLLGRAVDFVPMPWTPLTLFVIVHAVMHVPAPAGIELELVHGPADQHVHLGLYHGDHVSQLELSLT